MDEFEVELRRLRTHVGRSFLAISRGMRMELGEAHEAESSSWCVFTGVPRIEANRCLIHGAPDETLLKRYLLKLAELDVSATMMFAGQAKKSLSSTSKLGSEWFPCPSPAFMAFDLSHESSCSTIPLERDPRVYLATGKDYERIVPVLAHSFGVPEAAVSLGPFANAARRIDEPEFADMKIYLIDAKLSPSSTEDDASSVVVGSIVFSVTVEENSVLLAMGTRPEFRRQGLGRAVLHAALLDAKSQGLRQTLLFASDMGKLLYDAVGFKTLEWWDFYRRESSTATKTQPQPQPVGAAPAIEEEESQ